MQPQYFLLSPLVYYTHVSWEVCNDPPESWIGGNGSALLNMNRGNYSQTEVAKRPEVTRIGNSSIA